MSVQEFNAFVEYLRAVSIKMKKAYDDQVILVQQLNSISKASRKNLYEQYHNSNGKVTDVRRQVADILFTRDIELSELKKIIDDAGKANPKAFVSMYKNWYNFFYMFLYADEKENINKALFYIRNGVIEELNAQGAVICKYFDFAGERQTGSTRCWFAFINKAHYSQTTAKQLYLNIEAGKLEYSFYDRPANQMPDPRVLDKSEPFDFSEFIEVFRRHKEKILQDSTIKQVNYWRIGTSGDEGSYWQDMLNQHKVCIGWPELGNLNELNIKSKEDIVPLFNPDMKNNVRSRKAREVFHFHQDIVEGDIILAQNGTKVLGLGKISGAYQFDDQSLFPHFRAVEWLNTNLSMLNSDGNQTSVHKIENKETIERVNKLLNPTKSSMKQVNQGNEMYQVYPLNQILYGPPGTGKTYNTIQKAVQIVNPEFQETSRNDLKKEYDRLVASGQIVFTTFHQSMSYEDFIEGIKPLPPQPNGGPVTYAVVPGIFKRACALAAYQFYEYQKKDQTQRYSFDDLYEAFIAHIKNLLQNQQAPVYKTLLGREIEIKEVNSNDSIIARAKNSVAQTSAPLTKENLQKLYDRFPSFEAIKSLQEVKNTVQIIPRITEFYAIFKGLKIFERELFKPDLDSINEAKEADSLDFDLIQKNFDKGVYNAVITESDSKIFSYVPKVVMLIDEINRGNVSQIFGELITLIEEDKRLGRSEALTLTLPYSTDKFSIPPNLYIIGTMNTADRSVEALDTALRRRFSFTEMPPKPELVSPERKIWELWWEYPEIKWEDEPYKSAERNLYSLLGITKEKEPDRKLWDQMHKRKSEDQIRLLKGDYAEIDPQTLLQTINKRIEILLDRDHQIGHSYFMSVSSLDELKEAFKHKIVPLLQEYFFGDYGKIGLVLGKGFVEIQHMEKEPFAKFDGYEEASDLAQRVVYQLKHYEPGEKTDEAFKSAIKNLLNWQ